MRRRGQSLVEYSLLIATLALLILGGAAAFGPGLRHWFAYLINRIVAGI